MSKHPRWIEAIIPEGTLKNWLRRVWFKLILLPVGAQAVLLGPPNKKIWTKIVKFPFHRESLGEREIDGYLQRYAPKQGDVVVNAGAYHGYFAIYLSRLVGSQGHVICFEPEANNIKVLKRNLRLNNCQNVTIVAKGLWDNEDNLPIISRGSGSNIEQINCGAAIVAVTTLDEAMAQLGMKSINLLTMDIEGAEIQALGGATKIIINSPAINIAIASYHKVNGVPTWPIVEQQLRKLGLSVQTEFPRHLTTYAWR